MNSSRVISQMVGVLKPFVMSFWVWASDPLIRSLVLHMFAKEMPLQTVSIAE
jgi:hypothetical protein